MTSTHPAYLVANGDMRLAANQLCWPAQQAFKEVNKPGEIVWSRIFVEGGRLNGDGGRARAVELSADEVERRWSITTPQRSMMSLVIPGVTRDQMMARHKANQIQGAYARTPAQAQAAKDRCLQMRVIEEFQCGAVAK